MSERWQFIGSIWKEHQWLYGVIGGFIGFIVAALVNSSFLDTSNFVLSLLPEAMGITFGVFIVDRLYKYLERKRLLRSLCQEMASNINLLIQVYGSSDGEEHKDFTPLCFEAKTFYEAYLSQGYAKPLMLNEDEYGSFIIYIHYSYSVKFSKRYIEQALNSDIILQSIRATNSEYSVYDCLIDLYRFLKQRENTQAHLFQNAIKISKNTDGGQGYYIIPHSETIDEVINCIASELNLIKLTGLLFYYKNSGQTYTERPTLEMMSIDEERWQEEKAIESISMDRMERWLLKNSGHIKNSF